MDGSVVSTFGTATFGSGTFGDLSGVDFGYDPTRVRLYKLSGSARIGYTLVVGTSKIGLADDLRESMSLSSLSIVDGYTVEQDGVLSIDPATATVGFAQRFNAPASPRTNLLPNPSLETDLTGWNVGYPSTTTMVRSTAWAAHDTASMLVTVTTVADGQSGMIYTPRYAITAGLPYTFQAVARAAGDSTTEPQARLEIWFYDPADAPVGGALYSALFTITKTADTLLSMTVTAPVGATQIEAQWRLFSGYAVGTAVYYDAFMIEQSSQVGSFIVGTYEESWKGSPPLAVGDQVEIQYGSATVFQGGVSNVNVTMAVDPSAERYGYRYRRVFSYTLRSTAAEMLSRDAEWAALPAEDALTRLRRWFNVSTELLSAEQIAAITSVIMPGAEPEGSSTYIDMARQFTTATRVPVRLKASIPVRWDELEVVPTSIAWNGAAPTPTIGDSEEWANQVTYQGSAATGGEIQPQTVTVVTDDTRFLGGVQDVPIQSGIIGEFLIGVSRIGTDNTLPVSSHVPGTVVDVLGEPMAIARLSQTFGRRHYQAQLDVTKPVTVAT